MPDHVVAVLRCSRCGRTAPLGLADLESVFSGDWPRHCEKEMEFHRAELTPPPAKPAEE